MMVRHQGHVRIHEAGSEKRGECLGDPLAVDITGCIPNTDETMIARNVLDGFLSVSESSIHVVGFGIAAPKPLGWLIRRGEVGPLLSC